MAEQSEPEPGPQQLPEAPGLAEAPPQNVELPTPSPRSRFRHRLRMTLGLVALCIVLAVNVVLIVTAPQLPPVQPLEPKQANIVEVATPAAVATSASIEPELPPLANAKHIATAETPTSPPSAPTASASAPAPTVYRSVQEAAARSCSTSAVDGLSRQIVAQSRCIDAGAFVALGSRPNVEAASHVFLYFDRAARDALLKVLDKNRGKTMKVHSALRTVAQQYLLQKWAKQKRCGIQLASKPGESNHETGLALDISDAKSWRPALQANGFRWLGAIDRVHFDYKGKPASSHTSVDVIAFQQLWNRNHPDDKLPESGRFTPATEERLKKAPASGFPLGPACDKR